MRREEINMKNGTKLIIAALASLFLFAGICKCPCYGQPKALQHLKLGKPIH